MKKVNGRTISLIAKSSNPDEKRREKKDLVMSLDLEPYHLFRVTRTLAQEWANSLSSEGDSWKRKGKEKQDALRGVAIEPEV